MQRPPPECNPQPSREPIRTRFLNRARAVARCRLPDRKLDIQPLHIPNPWGDQIWLVFLVDTREKGREEKEETQQVFDQ